MKWQPMDTAPKDGTRVLLWNCVRTGVVEGGVQTFRESAVVGVYEHDKSGWYGGGWRVCPTYWMPLPAPPNENAATSDGALATQTKENLSTQPEDSTG